MKGFKKITLKWFTTKKKTSLQWFQRRRYGKYEQVLGVELESDEIEVSSMVQVYDRDAYI